MKKVSMYGLLLFFLSMGSAFTNSLIFLDTSCSDPVIYRRFFNLAEQAGFKVTYKNLPDLIDTSFVESSLKTADLVCFLLDDTLVAQMHDSPISQKIVRMIQDRSSVAGGITALFLPSLASLAYKKIMKGHFLTVYNKILLSFGIRVTALGNFDRFGEQAESTIDFSGSAFKAKVEELLKSPFLWMGSYATSLQPGKNRVAQMHVQGDSLGFFLPLIRKNHRLFIANNAVCSYASITENFRLAPLDLSLQKQMDEDIFYGFYRLKHAVVELQQQEPEEQKELDRQLLEGGKTEARTGNKTPVLAWMEIEGFKDSALKADQERIIQAIVRGNFDGLWLAISPNQYFSVRAKFLNRKEDLEKALQAFSTQLKEACLKENKKIPKMYISFEIANNFVEQFKHPQKQASDLYGTVYADIPDPLDRTWWREEVLDSIERFMPFWRVHTNNWEVAGFFLDLEMYLRNESKTSEFVGTAISPSVQQKFFAKELPSKPHAVADELMGSKRAREYFTFLKTEAKALGEWLYKSLQKVAPNTRLGCYGATVSMDWFYQGLYQGLSQAQDQFWLCSFNSRFDWFQSICTEKNMKITYFSALMLSQIKTTADFGIFDSLKKYNEGIWLNKLCRMGHEYRSGQWYDLEQTPLSFDDRLKFLDHVAQK